MPLTKKQEERREERRSAILSLLKNDGPQPGPALQRAAKLSGPTWFLVCNWLKESGAIVQHGAKGASIYALPGQKVDRSEARKKDTAPRTPRRTSREKPRANGNGSHSNGSHTSTNGHSGCALDVLLQVQEYHSNELAKINKAIAILQGD